MHHPSKEVMPINGTANKSAVNYAKLMDTHVISNMKTYKMIKCTSEFVFRQQNNYVTACLEIIKNISICRNLVLKNESLKSRTFILYATRETAQSHMCSKRILHMAWCFTKSDVKVWHQKTRRVPTYLLCGQQR